MAEENNNTQAPGQAAPTVQNGTQNTPAKAPLVKRIKVPVARPAEAPQGAAPSSSTAPSAPVKQPAPAQQQPVAPAAQQAVPSENSPASEIKTEVPLVHPSADEETVIQTDPAAQVEEGHEKVPEPELPKEDKGAIPSAIEADEIEKEPIRKRRRVGGRSSNAKGGDENLQKAVGMVQKVWENKPARFGILAGVVLIIIFSIYSYLPTLAQKKLPEIFAANGMPIRSFKVNALTMDTMEMSSVSDTSGTMTITKLKASYSLWNLMMNNEINQLEVNGLTINGEKTDEGVSFGAAGPLFMSPMRAKKGTALIINKITIANSRFILNNPAVQNVEEEEPEVEPEPVYDEVTGELIEPEEKIPTWPAVINVTGNGFLKEASLSLNITTDILNEQLSIKTTASLLKTPTSAQAKAEITEGNVLKDKETVGSVTGTFDISISNGALEQSQADLILSTPVQDMTVKASIVPGETGFNLEAEMKRSFKKREDAYGKFVGELSIKAPNILMSGNMQSFEGTVPLLLEAPILTNGTVSLQNTKIVSEIKLSCEGYKCRYDLLRPLQLDVGAVGYAGQYMQIRTYEAIKTTVGADPKDAFMVSDGGLLTLNMPLSGIGIKALVVSGNSFQTVLAINGAKIRMRYNVFSGAYAGRMNFSQSGYADKDIRLSGLQGYMDFSQNALPSVKMSVGNASLVKPDILPPLTGELSFAPIGGGREFSVKISAQMLNGLVSATATAGYTLASREWNVYFTLPKITFSEGGLQLKDVFPAMTQYFSEDTSGTIAAKGRMSIKDGKVLGPIDLMLDNVSTKWGSINAENISGVLVFSSLFPIETNVNQQLFVGSFDSGLPLRNVLFNFKASPQNGIQVASVRAGFADGQFRTIKSFTIPYEGSATMYIEGRGINLEVLSNMLKTPSLHMSGILDSEWKLLLADRKLVVDQAKFETKMPGLLEFDAPPSARGVLTEDMEMFLKNLIVKDMLLSLKGPMDGLIDFRLALIGHSPLDTEQKDQEVQMQFSGDFKSFLKPVKFNTEVPSDILLSLQNYATAGK